MPTFKNETPRYIDHWAMLQTPTGCPERVLIRFAPGEERALAFWVPYVALGLTVVDPDYPVVPNTILVSGTFDFAPGMERRFTIEPCDTYDANVIVQKGRVIVYPGSSTTGVEVNQNAEVPFHFKAVFDWEYAPYLRVVGLEPETRATVHAEVDRDYPTSARIGAGGGLMWR